ncbi:cation:dicarboxylase symporter family transporter, partial [Acinetobacter baumannii]
MKIPNAARILIGLIAGLAGGYLAGSQAAALPALQTIGGLWLDALRMPIVPLVFALIVTGLGTTASGGSTRVARRAIGAFIVFLFASAVFGVALGWGMFSSWQVAGLDALRIDAG